MRYLSILLLSAGLIPVTGWVAPAADASGAAKPQGAKVALETVMPEPIYVAIQSSGRVEVLPSGEIASIAASISAFLNGRQGMLSNRTQDRK